MIILKNMLYKFRYNKVLHDVWSRDDFLDILKQERLRSDRNNHKFSLITFDVGSYKSDIYSIGPLVKYITSRMRFSDKIGWFDKRRLAIFLPDTPLHGARKLAQTICRNIASILPVPVCAVLMYPSLVWNDEEINSKQLDYGEYKFNGISAKCIMPFWKRAMDIAGSFLGLVILSPLIASVAVMINIVSQGPVFFRQKRVGLSGKPFTILKFRTMEVNNDVTVHRRHLQECINGNNDAEKPMAKLDIMDSRIIPMGNFLRESCIDEIPQLINVLRGEMSLVGPRPCIPYEAEEYLRWQTRRFDITPGMSGLWQVRGKNNTTFKEMIRYDIQYAAQRSFGLDMKILLNTPRVLIQQVIDSIRKWKKKKSPKKNTSKLKVRTSGGLIVKA